MSKINEGDQKTPPAGAISPEDAAAVAANGSSPAPRSLGMETSLAPHALDKRWFLFGCGTYAAHRCAAKCAYQGYCKSSCSLWGFSCSCSCKNWCFPDPWRRPTCWANSCRRRYPDGWCHSGCGGGHGGGGGYNDNDDDGYDYRVKV